MNETVTTGLRSLLTGNEVVPAEIHQIEPSLEESVYAAAIAQHETLNSYIIKNPGRALYIAECNVAKWNKILSSAILTGVVTDEDTGSITHVSRNTSDLIKLKLQQANEELLLVRKLQQTLSFGSKQERLINSLYNRAVDGGDTRAMLYLIDRIDGRVADTKSETTSVENVYAYNIGAILDSLFVKQLEVLRIGAGSRVVCCSRRSGKSHLAVAMILISCMTKPGTSCLYIGETARLADGIFSKAANKIINKCKLRDTAGNRLNYKKFENGSSVMIRGLSNTAAPDTIRGNTFETIVIDEFFHLKGDLLNYLFSAVLEPSQLDYANTYKMLMIGTPPKERNTFGQKVWETYEIPKFNWTWRDNPWIVNGEEYLQRICREKNIDRNAPFMLREFDGKWIFDSDILLYPTFYCYAKDELPFSDIDTISVGLDYGVSDYTAIIAIAWNTRRKQGYVFFERKFNMLTCPNGMGQLAYLKIMIRQCWRTALDFFPRLSPPEANNRIMWSADFTDKMVTQELVREVHLGIKDDITLQVMDAHRTDQEMMKDKIRTLLRTGNLLFPENSDVGLECQLTSFLLDGQGNPTKDIDNKKFHPDLLPAMRYAMFRLVGFESVDNEDEDMEMNTSEFIYGGSFDPSFDEIDEA